MRKLGIFLFTAYISMSSFLYAETYHVSTTGNNINNGSESSPWKTIGISIQKLKAGDVLLIHGGLYKEEAFAITGNNISIKNHNNESVIINNGYQEFQSIPNQEWALVDKDNQVFRSVKKYLLRKVIRGYFYENGKLCRLIPYFRYKDLISNNENFTPNAPMYVGAGTFYSPGDGYVYLRLKHTAIQKQINQMYPSMADPNKLPLFLFPDNKDMFRFEKTASNITIEGLTLRSGDRIFYMKNGAHDITIKNCNILGGKTHISCDPGSYNLHFEKITIEDGIPDWIAWEDVKEKITYDELTEYVAGDLKLGGFNIQKNVNNISVTNSIISYVFDGIMYAEGNGLIVKNCIFRGTRDDSIELETGASNVEVGHNKFLKVSKAISRRDYGVSPQYPGTKYIHHNIIDCDVSMFHGREGSKIYERTDAPKGFISNTCFGTHGEDNPGVGDPWKLYNNTMIIGHALSGSPSEKGIGVEYHYSQFVEGNPQEVYNNLFIGTADSRLVQDVRVKDGSQVFDGNIYHRNNGKTTPMFIRWNCGNGEEDFIMLIDFKNKYLNTFETLGIEADPMLDEEYIPHNNTVMKNTVNLTGRGWPDSNSVYKGALPMKVVPEPEPIPGPVSDLALLKQTFEKLKTSFNTYMQEIEKLLENL